MLIIKYVQSVDNCTRIANPWPKDCKKRKKTHKHHECAKVGCSQKHLQILWHLEMEKVISHQLVFRTSTTYFNFTLYAVVQIFTLLVNGFAYPPIWDLCFEHVNFKIRIQPTVEEVFWQGQVYHLIILRDNRSHCRVRQGVILILKFIEHTLQTGDNQDEEKMVKSEVYQLLTSLLFQVSDKPKTGQEKHCYPEIHVQTVVCYHWILQQGIINTNITVHLGAH